MKIAIIIPARYASTRFPGKPLALIDGHSMLSRVVNVGRQAIEGKENISLFVATEDRRIADHAEEIGVDCIMTSDDCLTGSDRVLEAAVAAAKESKCDFDFIISLQGDAPFTPREALQKMIAAFAENPQLEVITPVVQLSWNGLDVLREAKKVTPFSGTTAIVTEDNLAIWFSKNIVPAIRKEDELRGQNGRGDDRGDEVSPVYQHLGLYGYRTDILKRFVTLSEGHYERLEGLEQLRLLENGISIHVVKIDVDEGTLQAGIDSPEDIQRAENMLKRVS